MSITWNGVSSDTIGVIVERIPNRYVPTRRFSPQQVAGRNGNILLVDKSFPNVEQEYEVYLSAEAKGLPSVARACAEWLMGPTGYCRLQDSYDTTVYREAFLMGGYDLENILNKFGRCTITFSCKPQKYLLTGDTPIEIPDGTTTTYTGDVVQFDVITGASITSLSATISPIQSGSGNPSPDNVRPISGRPGLSVYDDPKYGGTIDFNQKFPGRTLNYTGTNYTITSANDGKYVITTTATITESGANHTYIYATTFTKGHVYALLGSKDGIRIQLKGYSKSSDTIFKASSALYNNVTFVFSNVAAGTYDVYPMLFDLTQMFGATKAEEILALENGNTGDGVAWVKNLFPKDYYAYNAGETTCVSAVNGDPYWKKDIDWTSEAGTVYGGTLDVVTGLLTVDRANIASYNGEVINEPWLSSMDAYTPGATPTTGAQVVYKLATPLTYQLTPQEIEVLVGENNVWSSSGPVSVTVVTPLGGIVTNPTPFEARPMLTVSGIGEITINGKTIQILESVSDFDIDCETMEADDNSKIYCMDFPELSGGANTITCSSTITSLIVTPRWWTL